MKVPAEFEGVFQGIELTEREIGFLVWVAGWDSYTITNLQSVIQKVRAKAIGDVSQPSNEPPPCYQPDGDGCAYQCYDGDDEPIDKCKECPLCYSDKQRHHTPPNEPLSPYPDGDTSIIACPRCGSGEYLYNEDGNEQNYCGQCGQAIDWSRPPEGEA